MIPSDTIVAVATPHGFGGISVVRISGPNSKKIIGSMSSNKKKDSFKHKTVTLVGLLDRDSVLFEDGVVTFFKKPYSYTGEDVIEISCHGNPSIINKILSLCCDRGARMADPGEFTKRAFLNGKIDLIQAEAVASLIRSKTDESVSINFKMLHGELSKTMKDIKKLLVDLLVRVEFELDVNEGDFQPNLFADSLLTLKNIQNTIEGALLNYNSVRMLNDGASVVICGAPNAGKSTLLNCLSGFDRAITGPRPGTTRDTVTTSISIGGTPITLIDTAGLRKSKNIIEKEGVGRAEKEMLRSDCILVVTPANEPINDNDINVSDRPLIHVISKADLCSKKKIYSFKKRFPGACVVSAKTPFGISGLLKAVQVKVGFSSSSSPLVPVITSRQNMVLKKMVRYLQASINLLSVKRGSVYIELVSLELRDALEQIDTILGKTTSEDILDGVFGSFCVGK